MKELLNQQFLIPQTSAIAEASAVARRYGDLINLSIGVKFPPRGRLLSGPLPTPWRGTPNTPTRGAIWSCGRKYGPSTGRNTGIRWRMKRFSSAPPV